MTATDREGGPRRARKKRRRPLRWLAALAVLAVGGWSWFQWQCWGLQTTRAEVALPGLPQGFDGYRIAHLSDLHGHQYGEDSGELLDRVREGSPDLIVVTGDLIDQQSQLAMVPALARGLAAVAPTYYVTGNHEWALGTGAVRELKGVLAHRNDHFGQYANAGYDFVMSGHGHGGIVRLPFVGGLIGTDRRLFPPWTAGAYTVGDSTLFVSRGLGNNTVPYKGFRIFDRPELAVVTLRAKG